MTGKKLPKKRGPEAGTLKLDTDWRSAMRKALEKKRPAEGFPQPPKRKKK